MHSSELTDQFGDAENPKWLIMIKWCLFPGWGADRPLDSSWKCAGIRAGKICVLIKL